MKPASFAYFAPATVEEAVWLLRQHGDDGRVLAGGQSLVPMMNFRLARPEVVIDINKIKDQDDIKEEDGALRIGALVRHARLERPPAKGALGSLLALAAAQIAHPPIRIRGTFAGSIAHADPASEWCALALALEANMICQRVDRCRRINASNFFQGTMTTALGEDELLLAVELPLLSPCWRTGFAEFARRAGDFALCLAVAAVRLNDELNRIVEARLALGGVADCPVRSAAAEAVLTGALPSPELIREAAEVASSEADPVDDLHASACYRRDLIRAMVKRALEGAFAP